MHGMERDVVNVVPDFLTHWLGVPEVLAGLTGHWSTGEQLAMDKVGTRKREVGRLVFGNLCKKTELWRHHFVCLNQFVLEFV